MAKKPRNAARSQRVENTTAPLGEGECIGGFAPSPEGEPLPEPKRLLSIVAVTTTLGAERGADLARLHDSCRAQGVGLAVQHETKPRRASVRWHEAIHDAVAVDDPDIILLTGDDVELLPGCADAIRAAFVEHFPDGDGLVGLNQTNIPPIPDCTEFGIVALGRAFLDRFGDQPVYCPDYHHFYVDTELGLMAKAKGRFYFAEDARCIHHHKGLLNLPKDEAFRAARVNKAQDNAAWTERRKRNLLWGVTFDRVGG